MRMVSVVWQCIHACVYANMIAKSMAVNGVCLRYTIVNSMEAAWMDPRSRGDDRPSPLRLTPQRGGAAEVTVRPVNRTADYPDLWMGC